jgi:putative transposase
MGAIHKNHDAVFKAKVALETVKSEKTISQLSSEYGVHTNQMIGNVISLVFRGRRIITSRAKWI